MKSLHFASIITCLLCGFLFTSVYARPTSSPELTPEKHLRECTEGARYLGIKENTPDDKEFITACLERQNMIGLNKEFDKRRGENQIYLCERKAKKEKIKQEVFTTYVEECAKQAEVDYQTKTVDRIEKHLTQQRIGSQKEACTNKADKDELEGDVRTEFIEDCVLKAEKHYQEKKKKTASKKKKKVEEKDFVSKAGHITIECSPSEGLSQKDCNGLANTVKQLDDLVKRCTAAAKDRGIRSMTTQYNIFVNTCAAAEQENALAQMRKIICDVSANYQELEDDKSSAARSDFISYCNKPIDIPLKSNPSKDNSAQKNQQAK